MTVLSVPEDGPARPARTNMFVMATLYADGLASPVKIRNLSPTGALVEGNRIPQAQSRVTLRRGELAIEGQIVWRELGRAGLQFFAPISVEDWLPGAGKRPQQDLVNAVFHDSSAYASTPVDCAALRKKPVTRDDVRRVLDMLLSLSEALADDPQVIARHQEKLQSLDVAIQLVRQLEQQHAEGGGGSAPNR